MKVILSARAHLKMMYYIKNINYEISGLGIVEKLDNGTLYVPDIFLLEQKVSAAETTLDSEAVGKFWNEKLNEEGFPVEKVKLWWHSHVDMATFWSGTDIATINTLDTEQSDENWWLSIVGNKKGDRLARLDVYQPHRLFKDNLEIEVGADTELEDTIKKEIEEKVTVRSQAVAPVYKNNHYYYNNSGYKKDYKQNRSGIYVPPEDDDEEDRFDPNKVHAEKKLKKGNNKKI